MVSSFCWNRQSVTPQKPAPTLLGFRHGGFDPGPLGLAGRPQKGALGGFAYWLTTFQLITGWQGYSITISNRTSSLLLFFRIRVTVPLGISVRDLDAIAKATFSGTVNGTKFFPSPNFKDTRERPDGFAGSSMLMLFTAMAATSNVKALFEDPGNRTKQSNHGVVISFAIWVMCCWVIADAYSACAKRAASF